MIVQLRPFYEPHELAKVYSKQYLHSEWADHIERVLYTSALIDAFAGQHQMRYVADLSCGDGAILRHSRHPWERTVLGDLVSGDGITRVGPLHMTLPSLQHSPVDLYVCSETLEHVEDPLETLRLIRKITTHMVLTTPCGEITDENPQHYWGWDEDGLDELLAEAGFTHRVSHLFTPTTVEYYTFQIWQCS